MVAASACSLFGGRSGVREGPLWTISHDGSAQLEIDLTEDEAEVARKAAVNMLAALYERDLLPFRTKNYARTKVGVGLARSGPQQGMTMGGTAM